MYNREVKLAHFHLYFSYSFIGFFGLELLFLLLLLKNRNDKNTFWSE